jgi:HAD superfamily hydrolase (TIGR01509 family)
VKISGSRAFRHLNSGCKFLGLSLLSRLLIKAFFFDIDGTILDSATDICSSILAACSLAQKPEVSEGVLRRYIGRSLAETFAEIYPGSSENEIERLCLLYREQYRERAHRGTRVFPGIQEMLAALPGLKSTATTKSSATTALVLELFGLRRHFDHVQGSDNGRYKPDPTILLEAAEALKVRPEQCLMIGDAPVDMEAGRRAGMLTCAVGWGYGDRAELRSWHPDFWIDNPSDLVAIAQRLTLR